MVHFLCLKGDTSKVTALIATQLEWSDTVHESRSDLELHLHLVISSK
uniref:Uncharacterized protein n=1 Tax=Zea mays TaxID=4577 RepID=C0PKW7_MAIZE|nr:unknown [Zea mays]